MILLTHSNKRVVRVENLSNGEVINVSGLNPIESLFNLAEKFTDSILVWCHKKQKENVNLEAIKDFFSHKNMMFSFSNEQYLPKQIGYVEDSPFLNVNKTVKYPTWLMSSEVGAIHASQLLKYKGSVSTKNNFDYALNSIAKIGRVKGLFCYSEPKLLKDNKTNSVNAKGTVFTLFKFVKQHYKARWISLLLLNFIWHDKRVPLLPALRSYFYKRVKLNASFDLEPLQQQKKERVSSIDVLIPTIGRKQYLYDVLKDLTAQTLIPEQVIIVEQNPDREGQSELDYLKTETWPFKITHKFIHQTGACNARNLALQYVNSEYVFFADDDIRFNKDVLKEVVDFMSLNSIEATTLRCLRPKDQDVFNSIFQWPSFGSGCSIVTSKAIKGLKFNMAFEHGFGEDTDFGVQMRNKGVDIIYYPKVTLTHLKAPIGGFRFKHVHPWENKPFQPKPSPTVLLNWLFNTTKYQFLGYKTILFFKFYKDQEIKNPVTYYKKFKEQWNQSVYWANKLKEDNS